MAQVSETVEYAKKHVKRHIQYILACPNYPHLSECRLCEPHRIGMNWWIDQAMELENAYRKNR